MSDETPRRRHRRKGDTTTPKRVHVVARVLATCHPDREHMAHGLCGPCYKFLRNSRRLGRSCDRTSLLEAIVADIAGRSEAHAVRRDELVRRKIAELPEANSRQARQRRYKLREWRKVQARNAVRKAVAEGALIKSESCGINGCKRLPLEFHHAFGYEPQNHLRGVWLCKPHHNDADAEQAHAEQWRLHRLANQSQEAAADLQDSPELSEPTSSPLNRSDEPTRP